MPRALVVVMLMIAVTIAAPAAPSVAFVARWGGETKDIPSAIVTDRDGGVFVAGSTSSADFPVTTGLKTTGNSCAFATKLSASSGAAIYSTALCTKDATYGLAAAAAPNGELWVAGATNGASLPVTVDAAQKTFGGSASSTGSGDAILIRWSADGRTLRYATYFGGTGDERANALVADDDGGVWMAGMAGTSGFVAHYDASGRLTLSRSASSEVIALTRTTNHRLALVYATAVEGFDPSSATSTADWSWAAGTAPGRESAGRLRAVATLPDGTLVAAGESSECTGGRGRTDGWVIVFPPRREQMIERCVGGRGVDEIHAVAAGADGSVWITGLTGSSDFPVTMIEPGTQPEYDTQAFVANLDPREMTAGAIRFATLLGANARPRRDVSSGSGIAAGTDGTIFATGETTGSRLILPTKGAFNGGQSFASTDIYVVKLR